MEAYFATSTWGVESVTAAELERLGAANVRPTVGGVHFEGDLRLLYDAHLYLRTATRIVRTLREFAAVTPEMLYSQTRRVRWEDYLSPEKTLAVHATIRGAGRHPAEEAAESGSVAPPKKATSRNDSSRRKDPPLRASEQRLPKGITHTKYAALKIKDAIVDRLRREQGARPNVDTQHPDIRVQAHFAGGRCTLSLDATGDSLHERGYRLQTTGAPLKETLAAAIVDLTGWSGTVPFVDPMCGSGTLVIEAALKALDSPPGLLRRQPFGFERWPDFDPRLWEEAKREARAKTRPEADVLIVGSDADPQAIQAARANARRAGVERAIRWEVRSADAEPTPFPGPGVIVVNPPYGARLGTDQDLQALYAQLGESWKRHYGGWQAYVLAGNLPLARQIPLTASAKFRLFNGPLDCRLLKFDV